MTSRRTRLKAVINLPVRRGREGDQSSANSEKVDQEVCSQARALSTKISEAVTEVTVPSNQCNTSTVSISAITPLGNDTCIRVGATDDEKQIVKLKEQNTAKEKDVNPILASTSSPVPKITVPVRKRLKPFVSLSALSRKPKEIDLTNEKDNSKDVSPGTSVPQEYVQKHDSSIQSNSNIQILEADGQLEKDATLPICQSNAPASSASARNLELPSKSHVDDTALSQTHENLQPPTKVVSKSKYKLIPRLVDASTRRNSHSYNSESEEPLKIPPSAGQKVTDPVTMRFPCNDLTNSESDEEMEDSSQHSYFPKKTQLIGKNPTHLTTSSITSAVHEDALELDDNQAKTEKRPQTHRRPRKSGMGEMLSVARRDFYKKFGTSTPDKKKLTMFDLIFYNPSSNPMKHVDKPECLEKTSIENKQEDAIAERIAEESVDDVAILGDEENVSIPAPQVKVGPDGSLIIDEKSLVIETTGSQKRKDELANSSVVVDYGLGSATYNSFSKKVKPREWSKEETFKFYRALQSVGTDFLLMQSIFPNRTRGDLKQKYKKEDRLNRELIDKALRYPLEFDLTQLEKELEQEEKENEEREQKRQLAEKTKSLAKNEKRKHKRKRSLVADSILDDGTSKACEKHKSKSKSRKRKKNVAAANTKFRASKPRRPSRIGIDSSSPSEDEDDNCEIYFDDTNENDEVTENETTALHNIESGDEESETLTVLKTAQPTRYGRIPRTKKVSEDVLHVEKQQQDIEISEDSEVLTEQTNSCADSGGRAVPNHDVQSSFNFASLHNVEPGSLVILSTPGQNTLKLFMVAPRSENNALTHIPVAVTPEILASVSSGISDLRHQESISSTETETIVYESGCNSTRETRPSVKS